MDKEKLRLFTKMPVLQTDRLVLRKMTVSDTDDMFEYASKPAVTEYLLWSPHESPRVTKNYLSFLQTQYSQKNFYDWAVTLRGSGKMIGTCGFTSFDMQNNSAELGYVINPAYWGRGLGPEALFRIVEFGFLELGLHRLELRILSGNGRSEKAAQKCGFRFEGEFRKALLVKGEYKTYSMYAMLYEEYMKRI